MEMQQQTALLSKEQIRTFPAFQNLNPDRIYVIHTLNQCLQIEAELKSVQVFGFDTESKPTFKVGEKSTGPHLIQLSSLENAYLFQVNPEILAFLKPILENEQQLKVGFGLKNDASGFRRKGIHPNGLIDLANAFQILDITPKSVYKRQLLCYFSVIFLKVKKLAPLTGLLNNSALNKSIMLRQMLMPRVLFLNISTSIKVSRHHFNNKSKEYSQVLNPRLRD